MLFCFDGELGSYRLARSQAGWPSGDQSLSTLLGFPAAPGRTAGFHGLFEEQKPEDVVLPAESCTQV